MRPNNSIADAETQPRASPDAFGREERVENPVRFGNPGSIIGEYDFHETILLRRMDLNPAAPLGFLYRVVSVVQNIQEHLL